MVVDGGVGDELFFRLQRCHQPHSPRRYFRFWFALSLRHHHRRKSQRAAAAVCVAVDAFHMGAAAESAAAADSVGAAGDAEARRAAVLQPLSVAVIPVTHWCPHYADTERWVVVLAGLPFYFHF